ncbi:MAG: helix-turn-helix transcriptional regulator, partial [Clostridia bacterium]|nr:helix-turn-helix transcriptional regulator [Clostridia bacterium]
MQEQKIKQDAIHIGENIKAIRKQKKIKQIDIVRKMQLMGIDITRESLVKIERGIQHIYASQLKAIKDILDTTYEDLL